MKNVIVIGAGKIGATVAGLLASTGDYQVTLADRSPDVLDRLDRDERIRIAVADVEDGSKLADLLNGQFAVLNAGPFHLTTGIVEAARAARTHYLDLTEDVASVREFAANASSAFIPQCGLAPIPTSSSQESVA
jgi:saccharopine dehydrogenase-like NADP-dependent oxidoreductase